MVNFAKFCLKKAQIGEFGKNRGKLKNCLLFIILYVKKSEKTAKLTTNN